MINIEGTIGNEFTFYSNIENELELIIDVGAQDSFFTNVDCETHYFEPDSEAFSNLSKKIHKKNHYINRVGLGNTENEKILYNQLGSTNYRPVSNINYGVNEIIKIIRLDSYIKEKDIKKISLLKIDTEGMEYEIMKGMGEYLNICKYIVFEYAWDTAEAAGVNFNDIKNLLLDFDLFEINENGNLIPVNEEKIIAKIRPNTNNIVAKYRYE